MAVDDEGTQELAADEDGQGTRPDEQRQHSAFNREVIIAKVC